MRAKGYAYDSTTQKSFYACEACGSDDDIQHTLTRAVKVPAPATIETLIMDHLAAVGPMDDADIQAYVEEQYNGSEDYDTAWYDLIASGKIRNYCPQSWEVNRHR